MASSSTCVDDRDVARYVLAYLMEKNYSQTTAAFLQECECLQQTSSDNIMILPKVPLKVLINEHTARQNTGVMVKTLGAQQAWKSLWSKLQLTMDEISSLAQESMTVNQPILLNNRSNSKKSNLLLKPQSIKSRKSSLPSTATPTLPIATPPITTPTTVTSIPSPLSPHVPPIIPILNMPIPSSSTSGGGTPVSTIPQFHQLLDIPVSSSSIDGKSPRKKRIQPPKRKEINGGGSSSSHSIAQSTDTVTDQPEDIQHLLSSLMTNEELPWRLAELINQHVGGVASNARTTTDSEEHTNTTTPVSISDTLDHGLTDVNTNSNQWLDDLISTVFPTSDNSMPKTPPLSQEEPNEGVSVNTVPATTLAYDLNSNTSQDHTYKRPFIADGDRSEGMSKRLRLDPMNEESGTSSSQRLIPDPVNEGSSTSIYTSQRLIPDPIIEGSGTTSSLKLPDGVNLEQFLDQIHK